jgi:hypothetical protein
MLNGSNIKGDTNALHFARDRRAVLYCVRRRLFVSDAIHTHDTYTHNRLAHSFVANNKLDGDAPLRLGNRCRQLLGAAATG